MSARRFLRSTLPLLGAAALAYCSGKTRPPAPTPVQNTGISVGPAVLVGAGDIGVCAPAPEATAKILDRVSGTVFTAGDNAYMAGTMEDYQRCYGPTWGRHLARTRPVPGNHEYEHGSGGAAYFAYFGANAGTPGEGYYTYSAGAWQVVALNSEIPSNQGSAQLDWLRETLSAPRAACTLVYWHRPLFSSGPNGDNVDMRDVWRTLYAFDVDVVINGHDHAYERFAPQDPDGRPDALRGIREFVIGTGGAPLYEFKNVHPNSEARGSAWGVGVFTLMSGSYQWEFVPVEGGAFRDSGTAVCH
jgi:acid phosphatase type 7